MATILSHPAIPLAIALGCGPQTISGRLLTAGVICAVLPDLDVLAFRFGISYGHDFGHRGFSHSLLFALLMGVVGLMLCRSLKAAPLTAFGFLFLSTASHGLLDALTTGGMGVAFFWPFDTTRYFLPWPVIPVSPIGVARFISYRGLSILRAEIVWVWLPSLMLALLLYGLRGVWPYATHFLTRSHL